MIYCVKLGNKNITVKTFRNFNDYSQVDIRQ